MLDRRRFLRGCGSVAGASGLGGGETLRNVQLYDESTRRLVDRMVTDRRRLHLEKRLGPFVAAYHAIVKKYPNLAAGQPNSQLPRYGKEDPAAETGAEGVQHKLESIRQ
jgi:hypothetical protein